MIPKITDKILTIDDDPNFRKRVVDYFEDGGFEMFQAQDGSQGLEVFRKEKPDLVLTDLQMPVMDGFQVLETVVKESVGTPVIVVSSSGSEGAIQALRLGAWNYVTK